MANEVQIMSADSEDERENRNIHQELCLCIAKLQEAFLNYQALDPGYPFSIEEYETKHNQILTIIEESFGDIKNKMRSQRPSRKSSKS